MAKLHQQNNFFSLSKPKKDVWAIVWFVVKLPISLPNWIISFFLARHLTNLTLNPTQIKKQRSIHYTLLVDEPNQQEAVIINVLPQESYKTLRDYLLKFYSSVIKLPFFSRIRRHVLDDTAENRAYVDSLIEEISLLIEGKSKASKCEGKTFSWDQIYFKGCEGLNVTLHAYFLNTLHAKHPEAALDWPNRTKLNFFTLETSDSSVLDSVEVSSDEDARKPMAQRKFVIACMARDQNYINWLKDFKYSAEHIGCTVIGFNYRGICYSKGMVWTQNNMIDDALAQVDRLIQLGAKPENIGLEGMCLGGAVATIAAAKLHQQGLKVKLYNERSYRSLSRFLVGYILPDPRSNQWNPFNWLRYITAALVYVLMTPFIWIAGWHMDAAKAWDEIPFADKDYSVIRNPNPEKPEEDGIIQDSWASMASLITNRQQELEQIKTTLDLTTEQQEELSDDPRTHYFKTESNSLPNGKLPHHRPRRYLINTYQLPSHRFTMHDHMATSFKTKLWRNAGTDTNSIPQERWTSADPRRPLFLATSGGGGHISAIKGIIAEMKKQDDTIQITTHQAYLYQNRGRSILNLTIRAGINLMSIRGLGYIMGKVAHVFNYPRLPDKGPFWQEMEKLEKAEAVTHADGTQGRYRDYVDMLLDVYPTGYESVALNNTLHQLEMTDDVGRLVHHKETSEKMHYTIVYQYFFDKLKQAALEGNAYSELISTQPLCLSALCDAVQEYNKFVNERNQFIVNSTIRLNRIPTVTIHQYITDIPTIGCEHFLLALHALTPQQKNQMHLYGVKISRAIIDSYLGGGAHFLGIHILQPRDNPMIRPGFKDESLKDYLVFDKPSKIAIKTYAMDRTGFAVVKSSTEFIEVAPNAKIASIMLGSVPCDASVLYVKMLLKVGYDKIFIFGGLNQSISVALDALIAEYSKDEQASIISRIVRLGDQTDREMAPIMTRSECVIIRGGGLSVMEQMALPLSYNKKFLIHHKDRNDNILTSGSTWEDGNADSLEEFLRPFKVYAKKTSPSRVYSDLLARNLLAVNDEMGTTTPTAAGNDAMQISAKKRHLEKTVALSEYKKHFFHIVDQGKHSAPEIIKENVLPANTGP